MTLPALKRVRVHPADGLPAAAPGPAPELVAERERLIERMAVMQSELGGLFYEMAIRDHVRMDVLVAKAAELQGVDIELADLERRLGDQRADANASSAPDLPAGRCPACQAPFLAGAAYCSRCAQAL